MSREKGRTDSGEGTGEKRTNRNVKRTVIYLCPDRWRFLLLCLALSQLISCTEAAPLKNEAANLTSRRSLFALGLSFQFFSSPHFIRSPSLHPKETFERAARFCTQWNAFRWDICEYFITSKESIVKKRCRSWGFDPYGKGVE
ncbi:hypothetical protein TNCV_739961 [Trichonephila clavipes]|nr:hypothetical protein TNCV_739961 [Trichonephila clavipes]